MPGSGVEIIHEPLHDVGVVTAFHQLENQFSPLDLMNTASDMLTCLTFPHPTVILKEAEG